VRTTWREVLHAAVTVGRDVTPWLAQVPQLAEQEILSRCAPLRAYLRRVPIEESCPLRYALLPNEVYLRGTEITAKGAFSYRMGMTMAEWLCWGRLGMSHSLHAESAYPPDVDPDQWDATARKPDLVGVHPLNPATWLIEAKAQRRLGKGKLREGALQLALDGIVDGPHRRVLCGTSLEDRVFMTLDIDTRRPELGNLGTPDPDPMAGPDLDTNDEALYHLARASMLIYLILESRREHVTVVPVGRAADRRAAGARRQTAGLVTLLEVDRSTQVLRQRLTSQQAGSRAVADAGGIDMLTASVGGTGMTVGLSRRLFAACRALLETQNSLAMQAQREAAQQAKEEGYAPARAADIDNDIIISHVLSEPGRASAQSGRPVASPEAQTEREQRAYRRLERLARYALMSGAREGFDTGQERDWRSLTDVDPPLAVGGPAWALESATADVYLAVESGLAI
jgi:hypothetical protein